MFLHHQAKGFDTLKYCSVACARKHHRYALPESSPPFSTCEVCTNDRPSTSFVHMSRPRAVDKWGYSVTPPDIPPHCRRHIMPGLLNLRSGICFECISAFLTTQFSTRDAREIVCISHTCTTYLHDDSRYTDWLSRAPNFLPDILLSEFLQDDLELWLHTARIGSGPTAV
jgi:hypothetical protein